MSSPFRFLAALAVTASFVACGGGEKAPAADAAATPDAAPAAATASAGETLYQQRCVSCHQATGEGLPGTYPPLKNSEYATAANPGVPARILLHGISGPITVHGQQYNNLMPAYGVGVVMSDDEVAQLLTYIRAAWGNTASAVTADDVKKARDETASHSGPMTAEVLAPLMK